VPLNNIAIYNGCVACLELGRNLVTAFYLGQIFNILGLGGNTVFFQVRYPVATAASGRGLKNRNIG
jgi:hypothetical protein